MKVLLRTLLPYSLVDICWVCLLYRTSHFTSLCELFQPCYKHCNGSKFAYRVSSIPNYDKHTFKYKQHFQFLTQQTSVTAAAASARKEAHAKLHASSHKPTSLSTLFSSSSVTFPPPLLSPSAISSPVSHFDHMIERFELPPPLSPISEIPMDSINNTDTFTPHTDQQVPSICYTLQPSPDASDLSPQNTSPSHTDSSTFPSMPTLTQILQYTDVIPADTHRRRRTH